MMAMALSLVGEGLQAHQTSQALEEQEATSIVYSSAYGMLGRNHQRNTVHFCQPSQPKQFLWSLLTQLAA